MDAIYLPALSLFPRRRGIQQCQSNDHFLRMDDWVWKLLVLLYQKGFRMATIGANALEIEFLCSVAYVDARKHLDSVLYLSHAHVLLSDGIRNYVLLFIFELREVWYPHKVDGVRRNYLPGLGL